MLLFVYTTTRNSFVIFTRRYFKLSWKTTALSQSNCRNFSYTSIIIIKAVPRTTPIQMAKEQYLEPTISLERCPSISIWTVGHSKTSDILIGVFSSLHGHHRNSHGSSEINLDPLFPVVLLGWPASLEAAPRFQVESGKIGGVVSIPFARCSHVSARDSSRRNSEGSREWLSNYKLCMMNDEKYRIKHHLP